MFFMLQNKSLIKYFIAMFVLCSVLVIFSACTSHDNGTPQTPQENYYSVTYIASEGGVIEGKTEQTVKEGENAEAVTAVPNEGYLFVKWSDGVDTATRHDTNVTSETTATAEFEKITYTVKYLAGEGGTISGKANQQVKYGESAEEVTAVPDEGYYFVKWSDGVTTATRLETNVTSEITATAEFEKITYTVKYLASEGGTISGNANQQVKYGEDAEAVTAVPNNGYKFIGWSDEIPTATRQDIDIVANLTVTAEFKLEEFAGGIGTQYDPYLIENYEQFKDIYRYPAAHYKLIADIDLCGTKHKPIFDNTNSFTGVYNGSGYTIKNLTVETEDNFPSLFGFIGVGGIVKNLNIENADITAINFNALKQNLPYCVGILAGVSYGTHESINVSGNIHGDTFQYDQITIGGLIGMAYGDTVNCNSDVNITVSGIERLNNTGTTMPYVFGGLVGVYDSLCTRLNKCFAKGSLTVSVIQTNASVITGGLVGYYFTERNSSSTISDCQTNILIIGERVHAGGFIGDLEVASNSELQIDNCSAHGAITAALAGGFIYYGYSYGVLQIKQCVSDNDITVVDHQVAGFIYKLLGEKNKCFLLNCYSSCSLNTNSSVDPENVAGQAWGFGYQLSHINITNCYASGNISGRFGGGFIWSINDCVVQNSYSDCIISLAKSAGSGIFAYYIINSIIENCYSRSDIFDFTTQTDFSLEIIKFLRNSKLNRFYYAGNSNGNIVGIIYNSEITNVHVLENARQESDLIGEDRGEIPSIVDITTYKTVEEMYLLADILNKGLEEDMWVERDNDLPQLKSMV